MLSFKLARAEWSDERAIRKEEVDAKSSRETTQPNPVIRKILD